MSAKKHAELQQQVEALHSSELSLRESERALRGESERLLRELASAQERISAFASLLDGSLVGEHLALKAELVEHQEECAELRRDFEVVSVALKKCQAERDFVQALLKDEQSKASALSDQLEESKAIAEAAASTPSVVESRIDGDFEGWEGETIFKLENGQVWQQISYAYAYHYAFRPRVMIVKTAGGYKMQVEGVRNSINVIRIR